MNIIRTLKLNNINNNAKELIYKNLLNNKYSAQLTIDIGRQNKSDRHVIDVEFNGNDCCLSSWALNFYCRTQKAVKQERYKTFGSCLSALKRLAKNHGINIVSNLRIYKSVKTLDFDGKKFFYNRVHIFSIEL